jgi:hypothetical protein
MSATSQVVRPTATKLQVDLTHVAWFDANGDGRIDSRSPLDGGDGTLLLPAHEVDLPTYSRSVARTNTPAPNGSKTHGDTTGTDTKGSTAPANDVQTRQAIDAYQRYGQPAPVVTVADVTVDNAATVASTTADTTSTATKDRAA